MFVPVPTPQEMALWDREAIALGMAEETLMESAAIAAMGVLRRAAKERGLSLTSSRVLLVAGKGNNGGDAFCMARHLLDAGAKPLIVCTRPPSDTRGAAGHWMDAAMRLGVPFLPDEEWEKALLFAPNIVVDALLGTGFHKELREREKTLVENINALSAGLVLAIDVPSGLDARTGVPCPNAVRAHVTATFQAAKPGLIVPWAEKFTGEVHVLPIGIPRAVTQANPPSFRTWLIAGQRDEDCDAPYIVEHGVSPRMERIFNMPAIPLKHGPAHKGEAGRVFIAGGCASYTGAPCLAAWAALRAGAGLVTIAGPEPVLNTARCTMPAVITKELAPAPFRDWRAEHASPLAEAAKDCGALVLGPGLGRSEGALAFCEALLNIPGLPPMVIDADALFTLAKKPDLLALLRPCDVLTPHPGEAAAILGISAKDVQKNRFIALEKLTLLAPAIWVLKGEGTLIGTIGEPAVISPWSVPQLAVAGSGDALAGIIGALMARGGKAMASAAMGVWQHALSGMILAKEFPLRGNSPRDLADALPRVAHLTRFPQKENICALF